MGCPTSGRAMGEWKDGKHDGKGFRMYSNGGEFKDHEAYNGQWKDGKRHGEGLDWVILH